MCLAFSKTKKLIIFSLLMLLMLPLVACSTKNKSDVKSASINQVLEIPDSLQRSATYEFKDGTVNLMLTFSSLKQPNISPTDADSKELMDKDIGRFTNEFPNDKLVFKKIKTVFEKELKDIVLKIDHDKKQVSLIGKGINKDFKISDNNKNRLIDNIGIEYDFTFEK